jgi:hypothetical protein
MPTAGRGNVPLVGIGGPPLRPLRSAPISVRIKPRPIIGRDPYLDGKALMVFGNLFSSDMAIDLGTRWSTCAARVSS